MSHSLKELTSLPPEDIEREAEGHLVVVHDAPSLHLHFAEAIATELEGNNATGKATRLILPLGPKGQYPLLAEICNRRKISWANAHIFFMDEYLDWQGRPIPSDHPLSFAGLAREALFDLLAPDLRLPEPQLHFHHPFHLFGTDVHCSEMEWALMDHKRIFDGLGLDAETQPKIFGGTMAKLLGID